MLNVYIGYDPNESVAFYTLAHSILRRASIPVSIAPLMRSQLKGVYTRERGPTESTEFSLTRFLVPYLSGYAGWSLFMDCDMLCLADVAELAAQISHLQLDQVWLALDPWGARWRLSHHPPAPIRRVSNRRRSP